MEVISDAALRLQLPANVADEVLEYVDNAVAKPAGKAGKKDLVVHWEYDPASTLAYILDSYRPEPSMPEPLSPMVRDYSWPGIYKPFEHQIKTASFLSLRRRALCLSEPGTGKTGAAIWAADYLMSINEVRRVLVVCPLSIMKTAWQGDVFKTAMHRTALIAHGSKATRERAIKSDAEFVIINYDGLPIMQNELAAASFDLIIVDEANAYKNPTTKRWKALAKLLTASTRLWMMTGTPASQSPVDAYGIAKLVAPSRVPKFLGAWRDKVMMQYSRFRWEPRPNAKQLVFNALQPAIRYTKAECLDLPELLYQTREVPLSPQATKYYKELKNQLQVEAAGATISAVNAAAAMNKLLQISGGAAYGDGKEVIEFDITPRLKELREVLEETVRKVVVFVPYRHTIDVVNKFLNDEGYSTAVIQGSVSANKRSELINTFQSEADPRILIIQPQAASHGVTLTAADTIVFWSPVLSVETYMQCVARIDRVGQKHKMTVIHLQGSAMERRVYDMLQGKIDSHNKLVDLYKQEFSL